MSQWIKPVSLQGLFVSIEPMEIGHVEEISHAVKDGELWKLWFTSIPSPESAQEYVETALQEQREGRSVPFVIRNLLTNTVVGSTRFCNVDANNKRVEIGHTWYSKSVQRTAINTECKLLLLQHAFEQLNAIAVEFRTHWHNLESRKAISRLGAKQDGILRNHQRTSDGSYRDTVVFSIIDHEWPVVKKSLKFRLEK